MTPSMNGGDVVVPDNAQFSVRSRRSKDVLGLFNVQCPFSVALNM
jgi:hypothetical protein